MILTFMNMPAAAALLFRMAFLDLAFLQFGGCLCCSEQAPKGWLLAMKSFFYYIKGYLGHGPLTPPSPPHRDRDRRDVHGPMGPGPRAHGPRAQVPSAHGPRARPQGSGPWVPLRF